MTNESEVTPNDLRNFLNANEGRQFKFERGPEHPNMEVHTFQFYSPTDLKLSKFEIDTSEYHLNHNEPGDDPELRYDIEGIDLIRECNSYNPEGVLVYFPVLQEFGSWDCDHLIINMFPDVGWSEIEKPLPEYVNVQWYPELAKRYLLRPWADERCSYIKSRTL